MGTPDDYEGTAGYQPDADYGRESNDYDGDSAYGSQGMYDPQGYESGFAGQEYGETENGLDDWRDRADPSFEAEGDWREPYPEAEGTWREPSDPPSEAGWDPHAHENEFAEAEASYPLESISTTRQSEPFLATNIVETTRTEHLKTLQLDVNSLSSTPNTMVCLSSASFHITQPLTDQESD